MKLSGRYRYVRASGLPYGTSYSLKSISQEHFADYAPILPSLFSLNHTPSVSKPLYGSSPQTWDPGAFDRTVQGILAVLLSLKKKPVIRYEKMSHMAKKLAGEINVCYPWFSGTKTNF